MLGSAHAQIDKFHKCKLQMTKYLVLCQRITTESGGCLNFGSISGRLKKWNAKLKINGGRLEGGGGVNAHLVPSQVPVRRRRVERTRNLGQ